MLNSKILLITAGIVIAALFSSIIVSTTQVLAAPPRMFQTNAVNVRAVWPGPIGQLRDIDLFVDKGSTGPTNIFMTFDTPNVPFAIGELTTTANVFQSNGLNSATLSPVTLSVCTGFDQDGNCASQGTPITIQATWSGFGSPSTTNDMFHFSSNSQSHGFFKATLTKRLATATGILDTQNIGQSSYAYIDNGKILTFAIG